MSFLEISAPELKAHCMCGGPIFYVRSAEEIVEAERLGAVAIGIHPRVTDREDMLKTLILQCTVNKLCAFEESDLFRGMIGALDPEEDPHRFIILAEPGDPVEGLSQTIVMTVKKGKDIPRALEKGHLIVLKDRALFPELKHALEQHDRALPIFYQGVDLADQKKAFESSLDGMVLDFLPSQREMDQLMEHTYLDFVPESRTLLIGIVALQGDYLYHQQKVEHSFCSSGIKGETVLVKSPEQILELDGICLPGGWSNLQSRYYRMSELDQSIVRFARAGKPVLAICAGMLLAASTPGKDCEGRRMMGLLQGKIDNNVIDGMHQTIDVKTGEVFTAAYSDGMVISNLSPQGEVIATAPGKGVVWAKDRNVIATTLHSHGVHDMLVEMVQEQYERGVLVPGVRKAISC